MATSKQVYDFINLDEILETPAAQDISMNDVAFVSQPKKSDPYKKILTQTTISIKALSKTFYKDSPYLEASDIENIKRALISYRSENEQVNNFKTTVIEDLTNFQNEISTKYTKQLAQYDKEKRYCERQISVIEYKKHQYIMDKLAKVEWPYDRVTKNYDNLISALNVKIQNYVQKIAIAEKAKPQADEKDILLYELHLKEKFASHE